MKLLKKKIHHTKGKSKYLMIQPSDVTTLIQINQYNIDKQNLERKSWICWYEIPGASGLVTTNVLNTKISEVENQIRNISTFVPTDC